ncbi:Crp/Fnr family transcriptional regulator [Arcobacteraceae bacterium]|nr:Crp/Fnr family transcriptional regulator [Arcobacteraceae bacterium]
MKNKLKEIVLFRNLDDKTLNNIYDITSCIKYKKGNIIFYEGDSSKYLYCLVTGIVKLYKVSSSDKEIIMKYFHSHELIAEVANFENIPYPATSIAYTDVELLKLDFEKFRKIIYTNPELSFQIQSSLIQKIKNLEQVISSHLVLDAKDRVAKFIYDNPKEFFQIKNIEIAKILNVTPETLSRILRTFKNEKLIDMTTKTVDRERLQF